MTALVGLDVGTTGVKALALSPDGEVLATATRVYELSTPRPGWAEQLLAWHAARPEGALPRLVLFGPHTDLEAHAAARAAGLGPMWARSKLLSEIPGLLANAGV